MGIDISMDVLLLCTAVYGILIRVRINEILRNYLNKKVLGIVLLFKFGKIN